MIKIGNRNVEDIKLGEQQVLRVYQGSNLVWEKQSNDTLIINGYEAVDMGDAGYWATCNIGANSPEESGLYFQWGDVQGWTQEQVKAGEKVFNWANYKYCNGDETKLNKYCNKAIYGIVDNLLKLESEDDAAKVIMGSDWRMPTIDELKKLYDLCNNEWITNYEETGVAGELFTLKDNPNRKIFFPASGYINGSRIVDVGFSGFYWSCSLYTSNSTYVHSFYLHSSKINLDGVTTRNTGISIRGFIPKS